eukprot:scpid38551/ scgid2055/ Beta-galactosidase-1-like protein 2
MFPMYRRMLRVVRTQVCFCRSSLTQVLCVSVFGTMLLIGLVMMYRTPPHAKTAATIEDFMKLVVTTARPEPLAQAAAHEAAHVAPAVADAEETQTPERPIRVSSEPALTFSDDGEQFLLAGKPFRILSGELHYFRVVPEYWRDRLERLKAGGLNTVSTYVAWNLHEPHPERFDFTRDTRTDLVRFIRTAHELGLYVMLRPGPYICAEWEFGGLPGWLLRTNAGQLRTNGAWYMRAVKRYLAALYKQVYALQHSYGGPIIAVQLENEYGTFGNSRSYLEALKDAAVQGGIVELLYKCDDHNGLPKGLEQLPGVLQTVNGNDRVRWHITQLRKNQQKKSPIFVAELWTGWFTLFSGDFSTKHQNEIVGATKQWLKAGASINYYMWHGGSDFYHNGAINGPYRVMTSSYDYDAPVSENGTLTPKFYALRDALKSVLGEQQVKFGRIPDDIPVKAYGTVPMTSFMPLSQLVQVASAPIEMEQVCSMEELPVNDNTGQVMGFTLYRHVMRERPLTNQVVSISGLADFGVVMLDGKVLGQVNQQYDSGSASFTLSVSQMSSKPTLEILVGSTGRNNYLPDGTEKKGLLWPIYLNSERISDWTVFPMEFDAPFIHRVLSRESAFTAVADSKVAASPAVLRGMLTITEPPCDTFVRMTGFGRGLLIVNGLVLGRYWDAGPQRTLYLPAPMLREGENTFLIMELMDTPAVPRIELVQKADLGRFGV